MALDEDTDARAHDAALLTAYANGDPIAAQELSARVLPGVLALARRMLRDEMEAEDVAQETMLRLWKMAPDWDPTRARVTTWTYRVATNLCTDRLRRSGRWVSEDKAPEQADETPGAEDALLAADRASALQAAMNQLPDRQRIALQLRHFEEMGNPQIAETLETSVEAVESLLGRAKRALAAALKPKRQEIGIEP